MIHALRYKVNIVPEGIPTTVRLSQNENGRTLQFDIIGDHVNIPAGSVVTISGTKPDGNVYSAAGVMDGLVATFNEDEQMTAVGGEWAAKLNITYNGETVATHRLWFNIDADPVVSGAVPSDSELNGLVAEARQYAENARSAAYGSPLSADTAAAMIDVTKAYVYTGSETGYVFGHWYYYDGSAWADGGVYQSQGVTTDQSLSILGMAADAKAVGDALDGKVDQESGKGLSSNDYTTAEKTKLAGIANGATAVQIDNTLTTAGRAADAKKVGDELTGLKGDFNNLLSSKSLSIFESGSITANNGTNTASDVRVRTRDYVDRNIISANALSGYEFNVYFYSNGTYVGCLQQDGGIGKTSAVRYVNSYVFSDEYDHKLVIRKTDSSAITIDDYVNILFSVNTDESLTQSGKIADAKITGDRLKDADDKIINVINGESVINVRNYDGTEWMEIGAINSSGEPIVRNDSYRTDFLRCYENSIIESAMTLVSTQGLSYYHYIYFYDENKAFINRIGGSKNLIVKGNTPINAKYYKVSLTYVGVDNVATYTLTHNLENANSIPPKTKWYVLGDSISAGYYSMTASMARDAGVELTYISPVTTEQGEQTGSVWDKSLEHNYWTYANKWKLHKELIDLAVPGQGYYHTASYSDTNGVDVVKANSFEDAGLIVVAWGFNDWHYNMLRGDHNLIDPAVPYPTEGYNTNQINTVNRAIWFCLGELIRKAPKAKIVVQTPMNGWAYGGDFASNWGIGHELSQSGTIKDIHDDIVYWADYYGLQILDMTFNNSIVNRRNIKDTIIDGSHPSDEAHKQLGRHVAIALNYC